MRYLTRRRIERAQDLLRAVNLTVPEVCMLVGFSSLGSFSSRFRDMVGESPTAYRDRWAARGGPRIAGCFLFMRGIDRWPAADTVDTPGTADDTVDTPDTAGDTVPPERAEHRNLGEAPARGPPVRSHP